MLAAYLVNDLKLPELQSGPALILPATVSWAGPTAKAIVTANTPQTLAAMRPGRVGWFIQNHGNADLWIDDTNTPVKFECICVGPGLEYCCPYNMVTGGELKVLCEIAGTKFTFREAF